MPRVDGQHLYQNDGELWQVICIAKTNSKWMLLETYIETNNKKSHTHALALSYFLLQTFGYVSTFGEHFSVWSLSSVPTIAATHTRCYTHIFCNYSICKWMQFTRCLISLFTHIIPRRVLYDHFKIPTLTLTLCSQLHFITHLGLKLRWQVSCRRDQSEKENCNRPLHPGNEE
jgi:hypothetical protein